jgi:hypothetical protein
MIIRIKVLRVLKGLCLKYKCGKTLFTSLKARDLKPLPFREGAGGRF